MKMKSKDYNLPLYTDENFKAFLECKYRLNTYKEEDEFYMTAN